MSRQRKRCSISLHTSANEFLLRQNKNRESFIGENSLFFYAGNARGSKLYSCHSGRSSAGRALFAISHFLGLGFRSADCSGRGGEDGDIRSQVMRQRRSISGRGILFGEELFKLRDAL